MISERIKVNDLRGNPIEIAAQLVWRVTDTSQALFDIDDYKEFVVVQTEAAVRSIGSRYAYDDLEHAEEVTLRGSHEVVNSELRLELIARLKVAGITVDECGLTHLAYAPEIAGRCCGASRRRRWSRPARPWSRARSAWSRWRSTISAPRAWSSWTTSAARPWCRT
jgi:regulator of protease activity HflC (stomatin/prohibitin superfamily)